jgi:metallophosphoesterase (TIGR03767 family)
VKGALVALAALALVGAAPTTVQRTIVDRDGDRLLDTGAGEPYVVRQELAGAQAGRASRRTRLITFAQLTDTQLVDEESPARVEYVDRFGAPFNAAYRPQEGLSPQVLEANVRAVRTAVSAASGRRAELVMVTGDNADNTQRNETRWFIDTLDGGRITPNSGRRGTCGVRARGVYEGVRGGEYWDPDRSGKRVEARGYAPRRAENPGRNLVRDFPGVLEQMNQPFSAAGVGVPWYTAFGNHDALVQGNLPRTAQLEPIATGCTKVIGFNPVSLAEIEALARGGFDEAERARVPGILLVNLAVVLTDARYKRYGRRISSDPARVPLKKSEWMAEHFTTRGQPVGHGFTDANVASGMGNYSFAPKSGLRFVALDTVAETGGPDGNLDDEQFRWLHEELVRAETAHELVFVFGHHSLRTMHQAPTGTPGDTGGNATTEVHYGDGARCATADPLAAPAKDETLRCLLLRHHGVVAYVAGHEHLNRVTSFARPEGGGFWEIVTASHIDWPQQSRLLDVFDNGDGTLSIFGTMIDHAGPARPPRGGDAVLRLASIARELAYNDPQETATRRGTPLDRNVELLVPRPYS